MIICVDGPVAGRHYRYPDCPAVAVITDTNAYVHEYERIGNTCRYRYRGCIGRWPGADASTTRAARLRKPMQVGFDFNEGNQ